MTEPRAGQPAIPKKPSPRTEEIRPLPNDYQLDPADRFPLVPQVPQPARSAKEEAGAESESAVKVEAGAESESGAEVEAAPRPALTSEPAAVEPGASPTDFAPAAGSPLPPLDTYVSVGFEAPAPAVHSTRSEHSRDHKPLRIAHLYPSLLNVAGDGGNLIAIQRRAQWRGIPVEIVAVEKDETPDFRKFDIVLFHGGQDVEMAVVAADFVRKTPSMREAVAEGVVVFAVCAGLQLLGHRYISNAGEVMPGAGILDLETRGGPQRFMQHAACEVTIDGVTETVVGFENHSGLTELGPGCEAFGRVIAGAGNNGRDGLEGARLGNVFATYLHGPCLPKNPWLTDQLVRIAVGRAEGLRPARVILATLDDGLEKRAHEVALAKAMANRGKRTALQPARLARGQKS
jgi:CobQ-like glutamine amidotransferase family enzyme